MCLTELEERMIEARYRRLKELDRSARRMWFYRWKRLIW